MKVAPLPAIQTAGCGDAAGGSGKGIAATAHQRPASTKK
jgi:hypothetical protein